MTFVKIVSWHAISMTYRGGAVQTRCGRGPLTVEGTLGGGDVEVHPTADVLPLGEKSCETCTRLVVRDVDR